MTIEYECVNCGAKIYRPGDGKRDEGVQILGFNTYVCTKCAAKVGWTRKIDYIRAQFFSAKKFKELFDEAVINGYGTEIEDTHEKSLEEKIAEFIVEEPALVMREGETCFIEASANVLKVKNAVIGSVRTSNHVGLGKFGTYLGSGSSTTESIRGDVTTKYPGLFYVTSQRMVMLAPVNGFEVPVNKISSLDFRNDGLIIYSGSKAYIVETQMAGRIQELIVLNNEVEKKRQKSISRDAENRDSGEKAIKFDDSAEKKKIALLRQYKELLDEGIITQEEFEGKKAEILKR